MIVSATTLDLLEGSGLTFDVHGEHELKGLCGKRTLFALRRQPPAVDDQWSLDQSSS